MIKKYLTILFAGGLLFGNVNAQTVKYDTIKMGPSYTNQIFYDMKTGIKGSATVKGWDIAHTSDLRDNCIRANHMTGLQVIHYKGSTNWAGFDTTGWKSWGTNWNDIHVHEKGAFNLYFNAPWGFGWGTYNSGTHEVVGDSMYLLAWFNGATYTKFQKFEPIKQLVSGDLVFRYADVDGNNEVQDTLFQSQANGQNYKYYTFTGKGKSVREPDKATWDISFNRYYEPVPTGPGTFLMYPVMGVESNRGTKVARILDSWSTVLATDTTNLMNSNISQAKNDLTAIGSGWKYFDNNTFKWTLIDTQSFMVKSVRNGDSTYWLLHFTGFGGSGTGEVDFAKVLLGHTNLVSDPIIGQVRVFPNPASDRLFVGLENSKVNQASMKLYSVTGELMRSLNIEKPDAFSSYSLSLHGLSKGMYILSIESGSSRITEQVVVQ